MSDVILRQGDIDRFSEVLNRLIIKTKASLSVLIHKDGHLLCSIGSTDLLDSTALAALISANFSSTVAIAQMLGEREFSAQIHKGKAKSIYISLVDDDTFLATIIDNKISLDTIRVYTDEYAKDLAAALHILYNNLPEPLPDDESPEIPLDIQVQLSPDDLSAALQKIAPAPEKDAPKPAIDQVAARTLPHTEKPAVRQAEPAPAISREPRREPTLQKQKSSGREDKTADTPIRRAYLQRKVFEVAAYEKKKSGSGLFSRVFAGNKH